MWSNPRTFVHFLYIFVSTHFYRETMIVSEHSICSEWLVFICLVIVRHKWVKQACHNEQHLKFVWSLVPLTTTGVVKSHVCLVPSTDDSVLTLYYRCLWACFEWVGQTLNPSSTLDALCTSYWTILRTFSYCFCQSQSHIHLFHSTLVATVTVQSEYD